MEEEIKTSYISYVPGPLALRVISRVHQFIFKASRGQIGKRVDGLDILLITTLGHKSGKRHETPMPYFTHPKGYLLIASNAGASKNPAWYHNLLHEAEVDVQIGNETFRMIAQDLKGEEHLRWWQHLIKKQPRYATYQATTGRKVPIVLLKMNEGDPAC